MKKRRGLGIAELVAAIAIFGFILLIGSNVLKMSADTHEKSEKEYDIQSAMRLAYTTVTERVKYSTAIFVMPNTSFRESNLTKGWSYFGMMERDGKNEIVMVTYDPVKTTHKIETLVKEENGYQFNLEFSKRTEDSQDKQLLFELQAFAEGTTSDPYIDLSSEVEAQNSLQLIDWSTESNISTAIAFRTENRTDTVVGRIVLIIDKSKSMDYTMEGEKPVKDAGNKEIPWPDGVSRVSIMKKAATNFVSAFQEETVELCMIPFSNYADAPTTAPYNKEYAFFPIELHMGSLLTSIQDIVPQGGTNAGDALRQTRYLFKDAENKPGINYKNYVILLVDGNNTYATLDDANFDFATYNFDDPRTYTYWHKRGQSQDDPKLIFVHGSANSNAVEILPIVKKYTIDAGKMLLQEVDVKPYIIALSSTVTDEGITNLKTALDITNPSQVVKVLDGGEELEEAFTSIREDILNELWYINGPKL